MIIPFSDSSLALTELVAFLFTRRETILTNWRTACDRDPILANVLTLSRDEFNDLLPHILDILQLRLLAQTQETDLSLMATAHGLQRWHKAHLVLETVRELNHLTQTLYHQLAVFQELFPLTDAKLLWYGQEQIAQLMSEMIDGSILKYDELQRLESANRDAALQQALDQMVVLSRQRGDLLRTSSHDLRGGFGIINSAVNLLNLEGLSEQERTCYVDMLNRNLTSVQSMLTDLMNLSRLESGEEVLQVQPVDAAQILKQMVSSMIPVASERGLTLQAAGPDSLPVETDPVKLQRIVQNILLNALKYTSTGFISVAWSQDGDRRWVFSIQDSGPGLPASLANRLASQPEPSSNPPGLLETGPNHPATAVPPVEDEIPADRILARQAGEQVPGEGIGLQIVRRLCDLLNANLNIETRRGRGTLFRFQMPLRYDA